MDVFTILRRNIQKKKGIFICIILLTTLIVSAFLAILGVEAGYKKGFSQLKKDTNCEAILSYQYSTFYDPELKSKIENVEGVKEVLEVEGFTSVNNRHRIKRNGVESKVKDTNTYCIERFSDNKDHLKLFNKNNSAYEPEIKDLNKGEIYLPLGLKDKLGCKIGDLYVDDFGGFLETEGDSTFFRDKVYEFKIVGFVASPIVGSNVIGWKEVFISDSDFEELMEMSIAGTKIIQEYHLSSDVNFSLEKNIYKIYSDGTYNSYDLLRKINAETKLAHYADGTITDVESTEYSGMYITIIGGVLVGFVIILLIVNLVVISNSISGEIETDYKKIGILKALGFSNFKIGLIMSLLYLFAEGIGFIIGLIISIFLKRYLGSIFIPITASIPSNSINILNVIIILSLVLVSSKLFIFIKSLKLRKISPIKAINGNINDIYFSPRLNTKLTKRCLSFSLSIKQFLSSPIRYISIIIILSLLSFFILTSIRMSNFTKSKNVYRAMGDPFSDICISSYSSYPFSYEMMDEIKNVAEKHSKIDFMIVRCSTYISLNDDTIMANVNMNPSDTLGMIKGRYPKYDNEFVTTKNICERYKLKIGDKVQLSSKTGSDEFILVGIYQNANDTGKNVCINYEAAKKLDSSIRLFYMNLELTNKNKVNDVLNELKNISNNRFDVIDNRNNEQPEVETYRVISDIICVIILSFAIVFSLIAIRLLTVKTFNQERLDLGIYKAVGFNTNNLRNTMAIRFTIASTIGVLLGIVLSILFSNQLLGLMLSNLGLNNMKSNNTILDYLLIILGGILVTYFGAYISSRRIKKISTRELVVE